MWICRLSFAQKSIFSGFKFFNKPETSDSGPMAYSPSRRICVQDFYVLKISICINWVWTCEPWISRKARYLKTDLFCLLVFQSYLNLLQLSRCGLHISSYWWFFLQFSLWCLYLLALLFSICSICKLN